MDVSIIMPSYNRYPFNLVALYALEQQNFDLSKMEVILVDDASTDKTPILRKYSFAFPFKYIRNKTNKGLACTRNIGLKKAKGKIIIFLDAEMVVDPNYVKNNYLHHLTNKKAVVIGGKGGARLYSFIFPEFNSRQIKEFNKLLEHEIVNKRVCEKVNLDGSIFTVQSIVTTLKDSVTLLSKQDIENFDILDNFTVPKRHVRRIISQLGNRLSDSRIAWMACLGNLSIRKSFAKEVGGFDEDFKEWGSEDVEFSYRLYRGGATFIIDEKLKRFHQEHPELEEKRTNWKKNILMFQKKHMDIDVCIRSLSSVHRLDYNSIESVILEYDLLGSLYPKYEEFRKAIISLLHHICLLESEEKDIFDLLNTCPFLKNPQMKEKVFQFRDEIASIGDYKTLISVFDILIAK